MKFFSTLALFAAGALTVQAASPVERGTPTLVERDGATVSSAIASISSATAALSTAVSNFQSINDALALNAAATNVQTAITSGTSAVSGTSDLTNDEALPLAGQIQSLSTLINSTITTLIMKKSTFDMANIGPIVLSTLQMQLTATQAFSSAVISKIPTSLQGIAMNLSQPIIDSLNAGIAAYSSESSSSSMGGSSPTTSASMSASMTSASVSIATHTSGIAAPTNIAGYAAYAVAAAAAVVAAV